jgi:hypothetical protein
VELSEHFFRRESGRMVAGLTSIFGVHNLALAEDVVRSGPYGVSVDASDRSASNLALKRCASAMRSTSTAMASTDC